MSTFIIRNKKTLEQWVASSGKNAWKKANHAKAAFANSSGKVKRDPLLADFVSKLDRYKSLYFDEQDVYEVVEVYSDKEVVMQSRVQKVSYKLDTLRQKLDHFSGGLSLDQYYDLSGDIETLQYLVDEIIKN